MKKNKQKGVGEIGFIVIVLILLFLIWLALGGKNKVQVNTKTDAKPFITSPIGNYNPSPGPVYQY